MYELICTKGAVGYLIVGTVVDIPSCALGMLWPWSGVLNMKECVPLSLHRNMANLWYSTDSDKHCKPHPVSA
jgi:hypothetical protein